MFTDKKSKPSSRPHVSKITIQRVFDDSPDLSYLGKFSNEWEEGAIEHKGDSHSYKYFIAENKEYARQDYNRMVKYNQGYWFMLGIVAEAEVLIPIGGGSFSVQRISSGGLWGIESDSDESYLKQEEENQIAQLRDYLKALNVHVPKNVEIVREVR